MQESRCLINARCFSICTVNFDANFCEYSGENEVMAAQEVSFQANKTKNDKIVITSHKGEHLHNYKHEASSRTTTTLKTRYYIAYLLVIVKLHCLYQTYNDCFTLITHR